MSKEEEKEGVGNLVITWGGGVGRSSQNKGLRVEEAGSAWSRQPGGTQRKGGQTENPFTDRVTNSLNVGALKKLAPVSRRMLGDIPDPPLSSPLPLSTWENAIKNHL